MADGAPFATRTVWWLIAVGALSFTGASIFTVLGDRVRSTGANAFSVSAIGHRALIKTLERLDVPVIVSRYRSAEKAGSGTVLVVAEPTNRALTDAEFESLFDAPNVLYVLPKRQGEPAVNKPAWLRSVYWVDLDDVDRALQVVHSGGGIERHDGQVRWTTNRLGPIPEIDQPQLIVGSSLTPIVASDGGILVGETRRGDSRIWVLSDPDILANHGLASGDNAALAMALLDGLRRPGGAVVFDETHHGFVQHPSLWRSAFRLPFAIVSVQALIAMVVLMWPAAGRFGAPVPVPKPYKSGKAALIDNAANLVETGGVAGDVFARYVASVQRDVARRLHAPRRLDARELIDWLDRIGRARGLDETLGTLMREADDLMKRARADDARYLRVARRLNRWRQEILDGPRSDRDRRAAA